MTLPRSSRAAAGDATPDRGAGLPTAYDGLDDRALVARVTEGDGGALEALYSRYGRACYGLARRILTDEQLGAIDAPALFLLAAASEVSRPAAVVERLRRTMPHALVDVVPDAGHSLPVEHPGPVGRRIGAFLASVELADASAG